MNEYPITNIRAKYADEAAENSPLEKDIKDTLNIVTIPVLTEDNGESLFNLKPKQLIYNGIVYSLQDVSELNDLLYYSSVYEITSSTLSIAPDGTFDTDNTELAKTEDIKPLYYHGINMYRGSAPLNAFIFNIINNSPTPINSIQKVKDWANSIDDGVLMNGTGVIVINGTAYTIYAIDKSATDKFRIYYAGANGYEYIQDDTLSSFNAVIDNPNRIN